mgnify:CR=1 FL=1
MGVRQHPWSPRGVPAAGVQGVPGEQGSVPMVVRVRVMVMRVRSRVGNQRGVIGWLAVMMMICWNCSVHPIHPTVHPTKFILTLAVCSFFVMAGWMVEVIDDEDQLQSRGQKGDRPESLVAFPAVWPQISAQQADLKKWWWCKWKSKWNA